MKTVHKAYKDWEVDRHKETGGIKEHHDKLQREVKQFINNLVNHEDIQDIVKDLIRRCNIVCYKLKGIKLVKSNEIGIVVLQVQWLTENIETIATTF